MKTTIISSIILLIATGCSVTPDSLTSDSPVAVHSSTKSAKEISECISSKWENSKVLGGSAIINTRTTSTGYRITSYIGNLAYLADIETTGGGSKTRVWSHVLAIGGTPMEINAAANCQ